MVETRDLFISHSSGDAEVARELRADLETAGYTCWMAPDDMDGSDPWAEQILSAIKNSRAMLVLISDNANRSNHVSREVNLALGRKRAVLPIRIENVPPEASLEYLLSLVQRIDAFPPPISAHKDRILKRLDALLRRESERHPSVAAGAVGAAPVAATSAGDAPTQPIAIQAAPVEPARPMPAPAVPLPVGPGATVAGFTIEKILGEGGMATVYRAEQGEPKRAVALKVIRADHAADAAYRERFLAEKDTLASLEHPSIVPIYAAGEAQGVLYIAMRLVDGPDLSGRLNEVGRLSLAETIATLQPIADAIDYAHDMGVVHRDLKPSNIILDKRGRPYLTDFGLGKRIDKSQGLSQPGVAVGTLEYMAPEQFSGVGDPALAARIDIYALACVAYACLTGLAPFRGDSPERVMYAHLYDAIPSVRAIRPDLPPSVDTVLRKALSKNPADRFETGRQLVDALAAAERVTEGPTTAIAVAGLGGLRSRRLSRPTGATAGIAVALVALLVLGGGALGFNLLGATGASTQPPGSAVAVDPGHATSPTQGSTPGATVEPGATLGPPSPTPPGPTPTPRPPTPRPVTPPPPPPADTSPPTGGKISINSGASYTTSGSVTIKVTTKPSDPQSGVARYVWSTGSQRPSSGSHAYTGSFSATVSTATRGSRTVYVWFQNGDGYWSAPASDSITFDHAPVRASNCATISVTASGWYTRYNVWIATSCFTDSDGDALTFYANQPGTGSITSKDQSTCGGSGRRCWWYYPPTGWDGTPYYASFTVYATDNLGAKSSTVAYTLCLNC